MKSASAGLAGELLGWIHEPDRHKNSPTSALPSPLLFVGLAHGILAHHRGHYDALEAANKQHDHGRPSATATRDLNELVALEAIPRQGELKHTRYRLRLATTAPGSWK